MKRVIAVVFFILLMVFSLYSDNFLISLERSEKNHDQLNVYHITENYLIAGASQKNIDNLSRSGNSYKIIDEDPWSSSYYIVSDPQLKKLNYTPDLGKIIFNEDNIFLIKTEIIDVNTAVSKRLTITQLKQKILSLPPKMHSPANLSPLSRTDIDSLLDDIDPDSIGYVIQSLQDFVTRYAFHDNRKLVSEWIRDKFWQIGVEDAVIDSFYYNNFWHYNVVATIPGTLHPDRYVMLGGHHDSIVHFGPDPDPMVAAPGADDNASSVAAALEIARVMIENDYQPDSSIRFVTFAAEEVGLWGAYYYSSVLAEAGTDIRMMLNCDMIANNTYAPGEWILDIPMYTGSEYLRDIALALMDEYTTLNFGYSSTNSAGSDSYAFFVNGIPVSYYFEHEFSPHYHSIYDIIENCDLDYCAQVVRLCGAMVSVMEVMPSYITEFNVIDTGSGNSMILEWSPSEDIDFSHYAVGVGTEAGVYDDIYTTDGTLYTINDLIEDQQYYFALVVVDQDDNYSLANIQTGTPHSIPSAPENLAAQPVWMAIDLSWNDNTEMDLDGYFIYRSDDPDSGPVQINDTPLADNFYHDTDISSGTYYYYYVKAIDTDYNMSSQSNTVTARPVSLDSGLLVIDDTEDGTGTFMHPTDAESDIFIENVMQQFSYELIDSSEEVDQVTLSEMGPYSTVLWLVNSASYDGYIADAGDDIRSYLDLGGNFAFIGFRPSLQLDHTLEYPITYSAGNILSDCFQLSSADYSQLGRFYSAQSQMENFQDITVDTLKTPFAFNYHMFNIESIEPIDPANVVFTYGSLFGDEEPFGIMNDSPVGALYSNEVFRSAIFSFPLYYMEGSEARTFVTTLLEDHFGEMTGSNDSEVTPENNGLFLTNYPNPFNPSTVISFQLSVDPGPKDLELVIYNVRGQKINSFSIPGGTREGSIVWNGENELDLPVSSGLYLYQLKAGDRSLGSSKCLLLK